MADEVEAGAGESGQSRGFVLEFLDVVFAEIAQAEPVSFGDDGGGKFFRDRQEPDVFGAAARAMGGDFDASADLV